MKINSQRVFTFGLTALILVGILLMVNIYSPALATPSVDEGVFVKQEGSNWEAIQFAVKHQLKNLIVIIDHNRLQAMDFIEKILAVEGRTDDLRNKMEVFGFDVKSCDGHNPKDIVLPIDNWVKNQEKINSPHVLIANTIKGYGLMCMENIPKYHFRLPTENELGEGNRFGQKY